jgi:hypothetical protein
MHGAGRDAARCDGRLAEIRGEREQIRAGFESVLREGEPVLREGEPVLREGEPVLREGESLNALDCKKKYVVLQTHSVWSNIWSTGENKGIYQLSIFYFSIKTKLSGSVEQAVIMQ